MEPLFEHRQEFAGYETRVLELEGAGRRSCCCTATRTPPTPGGRCSAAWAAGTAARSPSTSRASAPPTRSTRRPVLPQLDAFAAATRRPRRRERRRRAPSSPATRSAAAWRCGSPRSASARVVGRGAASRPPGSTWRAGSCLVERDPLLRTPARAARRRCPRRPCARRRPRLRGARLRRPGRGRRPAPCDVHHPPPRPRHVSGYLADGAAAATRS